MQGPDSHRSAQVAGRAGNALDDSGRGVREKASLRILEVGPRVEAQVDGLADDGRAAHPGRVGEHAAAERQAGDAHVLDGVGIEEDPDSGVPVPADVQAVAGSAMSASSGVAGLGVFRSIRSETEEPEEGAALPAQLHLRGESAGRAGKVPPLQQQAGVDAGARRGDEGEALLVAGVVEQAERAGPVDHVVPGDARRDDRFRPRVYIADPQKDRHGPEGVPFVRERGVYREWDDAGCESAGATFDGLGRCRSEEKAADQQDRPGATHRARLAVGMAWVYGAGGGSQRRSPFGLRVTGCPVMV